MNTHKKPYLKPLALCVVAALYSTNVSAVYLQGGQALTSGPNSSSTGVNIISAGQEVTIQGNGGNEGFIFKDIYAHVSTNGDISRTLSFGSVLSLQPTGGISSGIFGAIDINHNILSPVSNAGGINLINTAISNLTINSAGSIAVASQAITTSAASTITLLSNHGTIKGTSSIATAIVNGGTIVTLNNTNTIGILTTNAAIFNQLSGTINTLNNTGSILASNTAISNNGTITSLNNTGALTSNGWNTIINSGTINTLTNRGTIGRNNPASSSVDIDNSSTGIIGTLINAQGQYSAYGALTFKGNAPSEYQTYFGPNDYGQITVSSNWDFTNITYNIAQGSILTTNTYTGIIQANGATFTGLSNKTGSYFDGAANWDWTLVFDSGTNQWNLGVLAGAALTNSLLTDATQALGNTASSGAAQVIDATPGLLSLFTGSNQQLSDDVESTLPGVSGGVSQMTNIATNAVTGIIAARQDLTRGLSAGDGFMTDRHIWLKPFGGWTKQGTRQGVTGYDINSYGLALGFDGDVSPSWNVGAALAYINSNVKSNLTAGKHTIDMDSYMAKVYATKMFDDVTALNLQAGVGTSSYDSRRRIFTANVAKGNYDSWNVQLSAELERSYQVSDKTVLTPYAHADYGYVNVDAYNESGAGALNLNVANDSSDSLIIGAGVKGNHTVSDKVLLMANAGVGYDAMANRSSLTSSFAGGGAQFTTQGIKPAEWVYNAGVGAQYSLDNGTEITASYNIDARQDYTDQSLSANFRFMF